MTTLPLVFALIVAFSVFMYVVMDGFDLGIGILFPFAPSDCERDTMMNSIGPVWDANETWLVLGGTLLFSAFPVVYAVVLPALYVPLMVMLFALIFRGVAFEFRFRATKSRPIWDWSFAVGSSVAAFAQGLLLGAFIDGVAVTDRHFAGGTFDFVSGFAIASGLGVMSAYVLLGATWLIFKTDGPTQEFARLAAPWALIATLGFIALISAWTPLTHPYIAERWFSLPNILFLWPVPLITTIVAFFIRRALAGRRDELPFLLSIALVLLGYLGLGISLWPYAIPASVTIFEAASSPPTLAFLAVGTAIALPVTLIYLGYAHWVFRGKTHESGGA
jgi:cytochrome bd ubiquinol oxidase subunit II